VNPAPRPAGWQATLWDLLAPVKAIFTGPAGPPLFQRPPSDAPHAEPAAAPSPPSPRQAKPTSRRRPPPPLTRSAASRRKPRPDPAASPVTPAASTAPAALAGTPPVGPAATQADDPSAQARYDQVCRAMLAHYGIKVRRWRTSMSGIAWVVHYRDGTQARFIESPKPKGPMSAAVFLHEIGHHAIGFDVYKPRCLEEFKAWEWSLNAMAAHGLNITDAVRHRMHLFLWYAVAKAKRRGIKAIPPELAPFIERPPRRRRKSG